MSNVQGVVIALAPKIAIFGHFPQIPHFCHFWGFCPFLPFWGNLGFWGFPGIPPNLPISRISPFLGILPFLGVLGKIGYFRYRREKGHFWGFLKMRYFYHIVNITSFGNLVFSIPKNDTFWRNCQKWCFFDRYVFGCFSQYGKISQG